MRPGLPRQQDVPGRDHILGAVRNPRKAQADCIFILVYDALSSQLLVLTVIKHRNSGLHCLPHCPFHQRCILNRPAVLGYGRCAGIRKSGDVGELFPLLTLCDRADLHHMDRGERRALEPHIIQLVWIVDNRFRVGHRANRRESAAGCCLRACPDILLVCLPRIAQMDMEIDKPRHHPAPGCVYRNSHIGRSLINRSARDGGFLDDLLLFRSRECQPIPDLRHAPILNQDICNLVGSRKRIQQPSPADQYLHI